MMSPAIITTPLSPPMYSRTSELLLTESSEAISHETFTAAWATATGQTLAVQMRRMP